LNHEGFLLKAQQRLGTAILRAALLRVMLLRV
jgi:hypothetical protein